ncbi:MAG TPA: carboxyltransferase domain-containing protein [Thermoanaerobaculia bacterium]|nr:carboxyltransferase domain-containing protein [Thermoanaerobaculia bacterium]
MQLVPAGDNAILVDLGDVTAAELHAANARASTVGKSIPGHSSLYVIFDGPPDRQALEAALTANRQPPTANRNLLHIPVTFDGEDLHKLPADFLSRVDGLRLTARYLGFRGGFAYLDGWPEEWALPRRATSRPVRAGAFAVAGNVAAFYPIDSPGGWNVLGHTGMDLENAIAPGDVIVVQRRAGFSPPLHGGGGLKPALRFPMHEIKAPLAVWTDKPFDDVAASLANRAVGNEPSAEILECPLVGPKVRFTKDAVIAWVTPDLKIEQAQVKAGDERTWGRIEHGLRAYLAIGAERRSGFSPTSRAEARPASDRHVIKAMRGPHDIGIERIECEVTPQLDRIGIRLRPLQALQGAPADLRSIGMQTGTVQLHPDGSLVAMGPEHPLTGGYLQPMTVLTAERWKLAQLSPGERVTFVAYEPNS